MSLGSSDVFRFFVFLFSMQIRFFPWRWSELQIKIFSYLFCRIFSISYSILHCKMLFENGFKRRIRWRNNGVGATVDSEMKMHWNEEVLRILALHFWGLSDLVSYVQVGSIPLNADSLFSGNQIFETLKKRRLSVENKYYRLWKEGGIQWKSIWY